MLNFLCTTKSFSNVVVLLTQLLQVCESSSHSISFPTLDILAQGDLEGKPGSELYEEILSSCYINQRLYPGVLAKVFSTTTLALSSVLLCFFSLLMSSFCLPLKKWQKSLGLHYVQKIFKQKTICVNLNHCMCKSHLDLFST